nr:putative ribonuclease H-like domain-containing protein [Tanacetum cinerariifolium]
MLADLLLPTTFWAEAINTACYVQNRVLITKPHNKTHYELLIGKPPNLDLMRPFGCPVILNILDHLGKFEGNADEGFLVGYSVNMTKSMKYEPVTAGNQTNSDAGIETNVHAGQAGQAQMIRILLRYQEKEMMVYVKEVELMIKKGLIASGSLNINTASRIPTYPSMPSLKETGIFDDAYDDREVGAEADTNNLELSTVVSVIPTTRVHKDHPKEQIIGDLNLSTQTRRMINFSKENAMVFRNKKDERGIVVRNKARLVAQGYTQEERIDYDEIFAHVAKIEAIRLFLAYASFMRFIVYQMDVKSAFLYGTIEEEVNMIEYSQDKYVVDFLKKFDFATVKTASTSMKPNKALIKDAEAKDVDVHLYRSMIGSLMYLTVSRPDIMFVVCAYARF